MTSKDAGLLKRHLVANVSHTHSAIEAVEKAKQAAESVATVLVIPLIYNDQVKIVARSLDNEVVFYTECSGADAELILEILGVTESNQDITDLVNALQESNIEFHEAVTTAAIINSSQP
jgi:ABC-type Na+ efflux pump permease subunit